MRFAFSFPVPGLAAALITIAAGIHAPAGAASLPVPGWQSEDGTTSITLRGRVYYDMADIDWSSPYGGGQSERNEFRTARLGVQAEHGDFKAVAEFDFSGSDTVANDVYVNYASPIGDFRVGHFKTMNSLDEQTSSRFTTFMERGLATDLFHLDRRIGAAFTWSGHGFLASAGVFGGRMDNNFNFSEADSSGAYAARLVWSGEHDGMRIHLGGSWRRLDYAAGTRLRTYPQSHLSNRFVAADYRRGAVPGEADSSDFAGLEAALVRGPLHAQAEYARLSLDGPAGNPDFDSIYIQAGWLITGETRPYKASKGAFDRIRPSRDLTEGGWGAFEVAVRYDMADMGDAALGEMRSTTLGVNWYPLDHVRVSANYVAAELDAPAFTETSDALQMRLQFDF